MAMPDLSALPADDLKAMAAGNMSAVSEPSLNYLAGKPQQVPTQKPNTGLAGEAGDAIDSIAAIPDTIATAASHAVSGVADPMIGLGARIHAVLTGQDPTKAAADAHSWLAQHGTYHAQTPGGKDVEDAASQLLGYVAKPFQAASGAIDSATGHNPTLESAAGTTNDVLGTAATLVPGISEMRDAMSTVPQIAKTGAEISNEAGYSGLHSRQDLNLPGPQKITNKLISDDAGVPQGQQISVKAVQDARTAGPAKVYNAAQAAIPANLTQDDALQSAISGIGDTTSQLPRSPDVDALKESMLGQPNMTNQQLFANIQQARERAANFMGAEDPDKQAVGHAYNQLGNAYEEFAGRQLAANPNAGVTLPQFQAARVQFAKNFAAEASLKGGENVDPMTYARIMGKDPDLLTGNAKVVGQTAASLPPAPPFGAERGLIHGVSSIAGAAGGAAGAHLLGLGPAGDIMATAGGAVAAPYIARAMHNIFQSGDMGAAGATAQNPALSYLFRGAEAEPQASWNRSAPQAPAPLQLTHNPDPTVNAGGGAATNSLLNELGLTQDVQRAAQAHPGAATEGALPPPGQSMEALPAPLQHQNWAGQGPDGVPNLSFADATRGTPMDMSDHPTVLSGHPTPETGTGGPEGTIEDIIKSALFKQEKAVSKPKVRPSVMPLGDDLAP